MQTNKQHTSYKITLLILLVILIVCILVSSAIGRYSISIKEILAICLSKLIDINPFWTDTQESILLVHRLPRILLACLVGASLASAGASYQGVFQNPMAAPDILGASSGAAFGAALAILLNMNSTMTTVFAFAFSLLSVAAVLFISKKTKGKRLLGLILAGIMIGSLMSSATSFIKLVADPQDQLPAITYWLMGSLNSANPDDLKFVLIPMLIGFIPLLLFRWRINLLSLGDDEAKTMGVDPKRLRYIVVLASTLLTAASVSVSGMIGWVGLVIPHVARKLVGNDFRHLLPASLMLGASFLLIIDNFSRALFTTEIPIGILSSFIGAPFFIYLITRSGEQI